MKCITENKRETMKKLVFNLMLILALCVGLQSCDEMSDTYVFERVQNGVVYTIVDMGKQFCGNAYTTEFKWFLVLYNPKNGKYYVKEVKPDFYYQYEVNQRVIFK